jgi:hypothetical protein
MLRGPPQICGRFFDSSVRIAIRYGLDGPGIESRWGRDFRTRPDRLWGPPSLLCNGYRFFHGAKQPERCIDHPLPSSAEVKERVDHLYSSSRPSQSVLEWTYLYLYLYLCPDQHSVAVLTRLGSFGFLLWTVMKIGTQLNRLFPLPLPLPLPLPYTWRRGQNQSSKRHVLIPSYVVHYVSATDSVAVFRRTSFTTWPLDDPLHHGFISET